jgi:hypothetical protein
MYSKEQIDLIKAELYPIFDHALEQRYCESLDDCYGRVSIAGLEYRTSRALAEVDPVAFRCGFSDWLDSEVGETITDEIDGQHYDFQEVEDLLA